MLQPLVAANRAASCVARLSGSFHVSVRASFVTDVKFQLFQFVGKVYTHTHGFGKYIYISCYFICGFNMENSTKKSQNECNSITTIIPLMCLQLTLNKLMNLSNMKH